MASIRTGMALAALLGVIGCGSSDSPGTPASAQQRPERIVSLSPSATETLFAVGAGSSPTARPTAC